MAQLIRSNGTVEDVELAEGEVLTDADLLDVFGEGASIRALYLNHLEVMIVDQHQMRDKQTPNAKAAEYAGQIETVVPRDNSTPPFYGNPAIYGDVVVCGAKEYQRG